MKLGANQFVGGVVEEKRQVDPKRHPDGPIGGRGVRNWAEENVVNVDGAAARRADGVVVGDFEIGNAGGHLEGAILVSPRGGAGAGDKMRGEIVRVRRVGTIVGVVAGFGRGPFDKMFRGLGDAGALEERP